MATKPENPEIEKLHTELQQLLENEYTDAEELVESYVQWAHNKESDSYYTPHEAFNEGHVHGFVTIQPEVKDCLQEWINEH